MGGACSNVFVCGKTKPPADYKNSTLSAQDGSSSLANLQVPTGLNIGSDPKDISTKTVSATESPAVLPDFKMVMDDDYFTKNELEDYRRTRKFEDVFGQIEDKPAPIVWTEGDFIGSGSYGTVVVGLDKTTGTLMAVKKVTAAEMKGKNKSKAEALRKEIAILKTLSHKNIVRYLGSEMSAKSFNIFLEYVEGGSLLSIINKYGALSENVVKIYTTHILQGLEYLHYKRVIHRDIKAANVLVDRNGVCKLADFGTAKCVHELNGQHNSMTGTVNWMAPEVIQQLNYGRAADIWSVGCTVYEMVTGVPPWNDCQSAYAVMSIVVKTDQLPVLPATVSAECKDFIYSCLKRNPEERLNVYKLLRHKFLAKPRPRPVIKLKTVVSTGNHTEESERRKTNEGSFFDQNEGDFDFSKHGDSAQPEKEGDIKTLATKYRISQKETPSVRNIASENKFEIPSIVTTGGHFRGINLPKFISTKNAAKNDYSPRQSEEDQELSGFDSENFNDKDVLSGVKSVSKDKAVKFSQRKPKKSMDYTNNDGSSKLALSINHRNVKIHLNKEIGSSRPHLKLNTSSKRKSEQESEIDFGNDENDNEVFREIHIVIKDKARPKPPKRQRLKISEPKVDLLSLPADKPFYEVPLLKPDFILNNNETQSALQMSQPPKSSFTPEDFLDMDLSPEANPQ